MKKEITKGLYYTIYTELTEDLEVYAGCTNLANTSAYDALMITSWGLKGSDGPLIESVGKPESQADVPMDTSEWNWKFYIYGQTNEEGE